MALIVGEKQGPHGQLLIITDKDIVGRKFEEGKMQLDLTKDFYQGSEKSKEEIKIMLEKAQHFHFTGKEAVALAVEEDLVDVKKIVWVQKVPHAQAVVG